MLPPVTTTKSNKKKKKSNNQAEHDVRFIDIRWTLSGIGLRRNTVMMCVAVCSKNININGTG